MNKKTSFFKHNIAFWALFLMGNGVIVLPFKNADGYTVLAFILALFAAFILCIGARFVVNSIFVKKAESGIKKFLRLALSFAASVFAAFVLADTVKDFLYFSQKILLPHSSKLVAIAIFLLAVIFFSFKRLENILKFCLISCVFVLILELVFFIASVDNFKLQNIIIKQLPNLTHLWQQAIPYIKKFSLPALLLPLYEALAFKQTSKKALFSGLWAGGALLGLTLLNSVLIFSGELAGLFEFAYASAVSTVSIGRLFSRMDGFSYFIYFAASLVKSVGCVFIIMVMVSRNSGKSHYFDTKSLIW